MLVLKWKLTFASWKLVMQFFSSQTIALVLQEAKGNATTLDLTDLPFITTIDDKKVKEAYDAVILAFQNACPSPLPGVYLFSRVSKSVTEWV